MEIRGIGKLVVERLDFNLGSVTFELGIYLSERHDDYGYVRLAVEFEIDEGCAGALYKGEILFFGVVLSVFGLFLILFTGLIVREKD